jgi:hypothetical protein
MPRKDLNTTAFAIMQQATGEVVPPTPKQLAGRKGGLKGGKTRMDSLSAEQRSALAKDAANKRWGIAAPTVEASAAKRRLTKQS